jgi:spermidine synthase
MSSLMLEILLTRITSVMAWYHLAFFVISLAMLGMTGGAVYIFVRPERFRDEDIPRALEHSALAFACLGPVAIGMAMAHPVPLINTLMDFLSLVSFGGLLALPFALAGITLTLALTRSSLPSTMTYGIDLLGAGIGCAVVIFLLSRFDAPSAVILTGGVAAVSAIAFGIARGTWGIPGLIVAIILFALGDANSRMAYPALRPLYAKGYGDNLESFESVRWNTYSRVTVAPSGLRDPPLWAMSSRIPAQLAVARPYKMIRIDGGAATFAAERSDLLQNFGYFDYDVASFAHVLRPSGPAAVIGVGGGPDVVASARVGHRPVVGVELNELILDVHRGENGRYSRLADIPDVELIGDEARSFMARDRHKYDVITMSMIDTWASTGAGAFSLSENGLYTAEAWQVFLDRLTPTGIFTVSRWYVADSPGEVARILALAMEVLYRRGATEPTKHLMVVNYANIATLLVSPSPLSEDDLRLANAAAAERAFTILAGPWTPPINETIAAVWQAVGQKSLWKVTSSQPLDLTPPTDARPFFFNMLKPMTWFRRGQEVNKMDSPYIGNLQATKTLIYATAVSFLLSLLAIVGPLLSRRKELRSVQRSDLTAATAYFALIGLGFMFIEMALLSRLNVFIGHPTIALAALLGGIILFTGVGSMASGRLPVESNRRLGTLYPLFPCALVLLSALASGAVTHYFSASTMPVRVALGVLLVAIPAVGLGLGFPTGLRLVRLRQSIVGGPDLGPWLWGINGAFGVSAGGLGLGCSMVLGVPVTLGIGALCYAALIPCTLQLHRSRAS